MKKLIPMIGVMLLLSACGGSFAHLGSRNSPASQATWPEGTENPDEIFRLADTAFQTGEYWEAQRLFGTLFIIEPGYRGGVASDALVETCRAIGDNCDLVFGRLEFLREAVYGSFGPSEQWPEPQQRDFDAILEGFNAGILGDYQSAINICGPLTNAPLPPFAQAADRCAGLSDQILSEQRRMEFVGRAAHDWNQNYPCMEENRLLLVEAEDDDNWEIFVEIYPQYQRCASVLKDIINAEVLLGQPEINDWDYNLAWSNIDEMDLIVEDNQRTIDETTEGLNALEENSEYNDLVTQWRNYRMEKEDLESRLGTMEMARENMPRGQERNILDDQIDMMEDQRNDIRRSMRSIMRDINSIRDDVDLDSIDTL